MKKKIMLYISAMLVILLLTVHFFNIIYLTISSEKNIKSITNEMFFVFEMMLLCILIILIIKKKVVTLKLIKKLLLYYAWICILVSLIIPRFPYYVPGSIEVLAVKSFVLADGDFILKGILLLILVNTLDKENFLID